MFQRSSSPAVCRRPRPSARPLGIAAPLSLLFLVSLSCCAARSLQSGAAHGDADFFRDAGDAAAGALGLTDVQHHFRGGARQLESVKEQDLLNAAGEGKTTDVVRLLEEGVDVEIADDDGNTPLIRATMTGQVDVIRELVNAGADVDAQGQIGATPLYAAVNTSQLEALELLLKAGADTEIPTTYGSTPLWKAAADDRVEFVKALLEGGADVESRHSSSGLTPLLVALHLNHVEVAKELLRGGADVEATSREGATALHEAARSGSLELVSIVLETKPTFGVDPVGIGGQFTPLMFAAWLGHTEVALELVQRGANASLIVGFSERTALHWAAMHANNSATMAILLDEGVDIDLGDVSGHPPVALAAWRGNANNVRFLLEQGAEKDLGGVVVCGCINADACATSHCESDDSILEIKDLLGIKDLETVINAVRDNDVELLEQLIEDGTAVNVSDADGNPAIVLAASQGKVEVIALLLENGADANAAAERDGFTALHTAVYFNHTEAVALLLDHGADVDSRNVEGFTAAHFAAQNGLLNIMRQLITAGANLDVQTNRTEATPLVLAVGGVHEDLVRELLDNGANPRIKGNGGLTLLHIASRKAGIRNIMELLMDEGLDVNAVTTLGSPPIEYAAYFGNREAILLLLLAEADPSIGAGDGVGDELCGCLGNVGNTRALQCLPGACATAEQISEIERLMGRQENGDSGDSSVDQTPLDSRQDGEDCEAFPTAIAQLECIATRA